MTPTSETIIMAKSHDGRFSNDERSFQDSRTFGAMNGVKPTTERQRQDMMKRCYFETFKIANQFKK